MASAEVAQRKTRSDADSALGSRDGSLEGESLAVLAKEYQEEFQERVNSVYQLAAGTVNAKVEEYQSMIENLPQMALEQREKFLDWLFSTSPLTEPNTINLVATVFLRPCAMLLVMSLCYIVTRYVLAVAVRAFVTDWLGMFLALDLFPTLAFYLAFRWTDRTEYPASFISNALLIFAAIEGVLTGSLYSKKSLSGLAPVPFLGAAAIMVGPLYYAKEIGTDRIRLFAASLGAGLAVHLVWAGVVTLSPPYVVLVVLYTLVGFAVLQYVINNAANPPDVNEYVRVSQLCYFCGVLLCDWVVMLLLSGDSEEMAKQAKESK